MIEFGVLGPLEARRGGLALPLGNARQRALLGLLLLYPNQVVPAERLVAALWGDKPPDDPQQALQDQVTAVRKALGARAEGSPLVLVTLERGYLLVLDPGQVDVHRFTRLAAQGRRALAEGDPGGAARTLREALALWRGPALADVVAAGFAWPEPATLEEARLAANEDRVDADLALGRHRELIAELETLVRLHPLREHLHGQLMLALYRSGRQADALAAYRAARRTLSDRRRTEPGQDLQRLEQAILAQDPALDLLGLVPRWPAATPATAEPVASEPAGARRRPVTVLVCEPAETGEHDPEERRRQLATRLTVARTEIEAHGGTVQQVVEGTMLAVFGLPDARPDDPERAVRAALAARAALTRQEQDVLAAPRAAGGRMPALRAVVASGEAPVRPAAVQAGARRSAGQVTGDLVTLCVRLQEATPPGTVLVTAATERATARAVGYGPASLLAVRGRVQPVTVWSALAPRPEGEQGRAEVVTVGREEELDRLRDWCARARRRRFPHLVTLVGPAGIGKSRLLAELRRELDDGPEPVTWHQGGASGEVGGTTCAALAEMVKTGAGILDSDPGEAAERKLARAVAATLGDPAVADQSGGHRGRDEETTTGREAAWVLAHLRHLVGLGGFESLHAGQRGEVFAAWRRFIYGLAARCPLVLAIEDLQWADDALLDFLDGLTDPETTDRTGPTPVVVVATARPELAQCRPGWGRGRRTATTIDLGPLSDGEATGLLAALLARYDLPTPASPELVARVAGNPLLAEEHVRLLRDRRAGPADEPRPASLAAVVAARIDALPRDQREVLGDLAVLGRTGWVGAVAAVGRSDRAEVAARLERLEALELVRRAGRSTVAGECEYHFAHAAVRDVAYGQIPERERGTRHERAADWLESLAAGRMHGRAEVLVHHYQAAGAGRRDGAGLDERARLALRAAGDRAAALGVFATAARHYAAALRRWPDDDQDRPELAFGLAKARFYAAGTGEEEAADAAADLLAARDALLAVGARARAAEAEELLARLALDRGQPEQLKAHLSRALLMVREAQASRSKATTLYVCALHCMIVGRTGEALAAAGEALAIARRLRLRDLEAHALCALGATRVDAGDPGGVEDLESGMEELARLSSPETIYGYFQLAYAYARLGDVVRAAATVMAGRNAADRLGSVHLLRWMRFENVIGQYWLGLWDEVVAAGEQLDARTRIRGSHYLEVPCRAVRGLVRLARGDLDGATADSEAALAMADAWGDGHTVAVARAFRVRALLAAGCRDDAAELAELLLRSLRPGLLEVTLGADFGLALVELGHAAEVLDRQGLAPSRWLDALRALLAGDAAGAADRYAEIGSRADEALARLDAGRRLLDAGKPDQARSQLEVAVAFWREVGADVYLDEAASLLAAAGPEPTEPPERADHPAGANH